MFLPLTKKHEVPPKRLTRVPHATNRWAWPSRRPQSNTSPWKLQILQHGEIFRDCNGKYCHLRHQNTPTRRYLCVKRLCRRQQFSTVCLLVIKSNNVVKTEQKQTLFDSYRHKMWHTVLGWISSSCWNLRLTHPSILARPSLWRQTGRVWHWCRSSGSHTTGSIVSNKAGTWYPSRRNCATSGNHLQDTNNTVTSTHNIHCSRTVNTRKPAVR